MVKAAMKKAAKESSAALSLLPEEIATLEIVAVASKEAEALKDPSSEVGGTSAE